MLIVYLEKAEKM